MSIWCECEGTVVMKQDVESLLGCKITTYTLNQLKNTLDKYNKD